jgi:hypothetical protein
MSVNTLAFGCCFLQTSLHQFKSTLPFGAQSNQSSIDLDLIGSSGSKTTSYSCQILNHSAIKDGWCQVVQDDVRFLSWPKSVEQQNWATDTMIA